MQTEVIRRYDLYILAEARGADIASRRIPD
jgi:hypothetical protein